MIAFVQRCLMNNGTLPQTATQKNGDGPLERLAGGRGAFSKIIHHHGRSEGLLVKWIPE